MNDPRIIDQPMTRPVAPYVGDSPIGARRRRGGAVLRVVAAIFAIVAIIAAVVGLRSSSSPDRSALLTKPVVAVTTDEHQRAAVSADEPTSAVPLADAIARTKAAKTATTHLVVTYASMPGLDGPQTAPGEGVIDFEHKNQAMTMDFGAILDSAGAGDRARGTTFETRLVDGVMYMQLPWIATDDESKIGKWIKIDVRSAAKSAGIDPSALLANPVGQDPSSALWMLAGADPTEVQPLGAEVVDGVQTIHYHADIDVRAALDRAVSSASDRDALHNLADKVGLRTLPIDAWAGADGFVHKVQLALTSKGISQTIAITFTDFGRGVEIIPPPATDVIDGAALLAGGSHG